MNKKITAALLVLLTLGMVATGAAQLAGNNEPDAGDSTGNESSNITVNVASTTAIDVKPDALSYPSVDVGNQDTDSDRGFESLEISNIGSEYIDRVWAGATTPTQDPFATGNPDTYNAGNFVQIRPSNSTGKDTVRGNSSVFNYVNRVEYGDYFTNEKGEIPSYIDAGTSDTDQVVGQFRSGDQWYFWTIPVGTTGDGVCDGGDDAELRVGKEPHSPNQFGSYDFTDDSNQYNTYSISTVSTSGDPVYGLATGSPDGINMSFNGVTRYYDVLTVCDEGKTGVSQAHTIRTRYNPTAGTAVDLVNSSTSEASNFLLSASADTNPDGALLPGEGIAIDTAVEVPQGVAEGQVGQGQVTFYVTSDSSVDTTA